MKQDTAASANILSWVDKSRKEIDLTWCQWIFAYIAQCFNIYTAESFTYCISQGKICTLMASGFLPTLHSVSTYARTARLTESVKEKICPWWPMDFLPTLHSVSTMCKANYLPSIALDGQWIHACVGFVACLSSCRWNILSMKPNNYIHKTYSHNPVQPDKQIVVKG